MQDPYRIPSSEWLSDKCKLNKSLHVGWVAWFSCQGRGIYNNKNKRISHLLRLASEAVLGRECEVPGGRCVYSGIPGIYAGDTGLLRPETNHNKTI